MTTFELISIFKWKEMTNQILFISSSDEGKNYEYLVYLLYCMCFKLAFNLHVVYCFACLIGKVLGSSQRGEEEKGW